MGTLLTYTTTQDGILSPLGSPGFIFRWNWMKFYVSIHITTTNTHARKKIKILINLENIECPLQGTEGLNE